MSFRTYIILSVVGVLLVVFTPAAAQAESLPRSTQETPAERLERMARTIREYDEDTRARQRREIVELKSVGWRGRDDLKANGYSVVDILYANGPVVMSNGARKYYCPIVDFQSYGMCRPLH
jgi:hypothetical protein